MSQGASAQETHYGTPVRVQAQRSWAVAPPILANKTVALRWTFELHSFLGMKQKPHRILLCLILLREHYKHRSQTTTASAMMGPTRSAVTAPSAPSPASRASIGAIIGATLGGLVLLSFLTSLALLLWHRRRGRRHTSDINVLSNHKVPPASSNQTSTSAFPTTADIPSHYSSTPAYELDTPPPGQWHVAQENAYEMPSPDMNSEKTRAGSSDGLGIYHAYKPEVREGPGSHELSSEGANVSHELHG
ncbi:MAG: hypothetical protein Q9221_008665 [Calogaya cf. arnoldii]